LSLSFCAGYVASQRMPLHVILHLMHAHARDLLTSLWMKLPKWLVLNDPRNHLLLMLLQLCRIRWLLLKLLPPLPALDLWHMLLMHTLPFLQLLPHAFLEQFRQTLALRLAEPHPRCPRVLMAITACTAPRAALRGQPEGAAWPALATTKAAGPLADMVDMA